jgi:hypothetical protein
MRFTAATQVPFTAITSLARLKEKYACGPRLDLDEPQRVLLEAFENLYPAEKLMLVHVALDAGRVYITGTDVFALAPRPIEFTVPCREVGEPPVANGVTDTGG